MLSYLCSVDILWFKEWFNWLYVDWCNNKFCLSRLFYIRFKYFTALYWDADSNGTTQDVLRYVKQDGHSKLCQQALGCLKLIKLALILHDGMVINRNKRKAVRISSSWFLHKWCTSCTQITKDHAQKMGLITSEPINKIKEDCRHPYFIWDGNSLC